MTDSLASLTRDEADASEARQILWKTLDKEDAHRAAYAALCRWTWRAMVERRLDGELRAWHRLLLDAAARIGAQAARKQKARGRVSFDPAAAAERCRALADLLRLSVDAADASAVKELTSRAHVAEILRLLAARAGEYVEREDIRKELGLGHANLSRVLTLLAANGLVEREPRGKAAAFRATQRALGIVDPDREERRLARQLMRAPPIALAGARLKDALFEPLGGAARPPLWFETIGSRGRRPTHDDYEQLFADLERGRGDDPATALSRDREAV